MRNVPVLQLNADHRPLTVMPLSVLELRDAIKLIYENNACVVAEYDDYIIRSPSVSIRAPSVIALRRYVRVPRERVPFTRMNVFLRDRFCCQYCEERFSSDWLTFDHVVPQSAGGKTWWDNIVAACEPCNSMKGNRRDMVPLNWPVEPSPLQHTMAKLAEQQHRNIHPSWRAYLFPHEMAA